MTSTIVDAVRGGFLAACFLRYMDALKLGDNYASPISLLAFDVAHQYTTGSELDRMTRRWGVENPLRAALEELSGGGGVKAPAPPRVDNIERYWRDAPPELSPRCTYWAARIRAGWRGNKRIRMRGYTELAPYFGVYVWEYLNVLAPLLRGVEPSGGAT